MVYIDGRDAARGKLVQRNINTGEELDLGFDEAAYGTFVLSPDGAQLAVVREDRTRHIWVYDLEGPRKQTRLTYEGTNNRNPVWSPTGEYVMFSSNRAGRLNIYRKRPKFTEPAERLTISPHDQYATYWFEHQDDLWLAISSHGNRMLSADGNDEHSLPGTRPASQLSQVSPDGRWLALGQEDVWIQSLPGPGAEVQVSDGGGEEAMWIDNNRIAYLNRRKWMLAEIETDPELRLTKEPTLLFEDDYMNVPDYSYAILPDGEHFILLRGAEPAQTSRVEVVTNWFDELHGKAQVGESQ
jgi:Tol biopolymer transport system component